MEFFRFHAEGLGSEQNKRVRARLGKPIIVEPEVSGEIKIIVSSYGELALARDVSEGFPRPLTFSMVYEFYKIHVKAVDFNLFKAIIGAIDLYEMNKFMKEYKDRRKASTKSRK